MDTMKIIINKNILELTGKGHLLAVVSELRRNLEKPLQANERLSIEHARRSRDGKSLICLHFLQFVICLKQAWHSTVLFVVCQF
jgi:hypothetical protein